MKQMLKEKKGIFFTSIAILISAVLILTFSNPTSVTTKDQIPLTQAKADAVNSQARYLKYSYLPQALYIASYSSFYAMADYLRQRGGYFQGADADLKFEIALKEMIINGTMCCGLPGHIGCDSDSISDINNPAKHEGVDQCLGLQIMSNRNFTKRLLDMENASFSAFRINTTLFKDYTSMAMVFWQDNTTGPWQVGVNITVNYSIAAGDVMINKTENITTIFDIKGIPDPLYAIGSLAESNDGNVQYTNYFNRTNVTNWNITTFYSEIEWRLYTQSPNASSFLMRLLGKDEPSSCCGIESLINPLTMTSVNGLVEKPYVDWCYYGAANRCSVTQLGAMWNLTCATSDTDGTKFYRFALDTTHALQYNLTNDQKDYLYGAGPAPSCPETPFP